MMARNNALYNLLDQNIKRWAYFTVFMDVFTRRAIAPFWCAFHVAKCIHKTRKILSWWGDWPRDPLLLPYFFPQTDSSFSKSLEGNKFCKRAKKKHIKWEEPDYPPIESKEQKNCTQRRRKLSSLSGSSLNILTAPQSLDRKSNATHPKPLNNLTIKPQQLLHQAV